MQNKLIACLLAFAATPAFAQTPTPAKGDLLPDAVAIQCVKIVPTGDDIIVENSCSYRIAVAVCVPRNAPKSMLCKSDVAEGEDISARILRISNRGNMGTSFPNGSVIYQMACKQPAIPVLVNATGGKCLQP